ncbi:MULTISPECIES: enoyl-CoA hydratase/isomerase family protein [Bacillaceae]|uniref:enoyl-CoA hydratase/isomerase family protein n=1 Tax=Bacillaceae TaxID=186817 RepID=UPI0011A1A57D|nr:MULTISPECIES: enoyl-CoA hydratase/isomerase family protein [Bacillaceae]MBU8790191.1 enoyl-CoA hydratase/isomerase family protein [Oceanobacillus caeni]MED4473094.1 enoyl-CoA hydratase/isomerase family protein [Oceanobacillus caeni]
MFVEYQKKKDYGVIYLNRPEKRNAISKEMAAMLGTILDKAKKEEIKFLVLTSKDNKMFCAGGDLTYLHGNLSREEAYARLNPMKEILYKIALFPVPVIALLNGNALGGGCELATACDIRIARKNTKFGFIQANLGILPGWGGGTLLYHKVSSSFALEWLTEARVMDCHLLEKKGWINRVVNEHEIDDMDVLLKDYISKSYRQMRLLKDQHIKSWTNRNLFFEMTEEVKKTAMLWDSEEHKQAVEKFLLRK